MTYQGQDLSCVIAVMSQARFDCRIPFFHAFRAWLCYDNSTSINQGLSVPSQSVHNERERIVEYRFLFDGSQRSANHDLDFKVLLEELYTLGTPDEISVGGPSATCWVPRIRCCNLPGKTLCYIQQQIRYHQILTIASSSRKLLDPPRRRPNAKEIR